MADGLGGPPACRGVFWNNTGNLAVDQDVWNYRKNRNSIKVTDTHHRVVLVTLTDEQIEKAECSDGRKQGIAHVLICEPDGQMLGSER